MPNQSKIFTKQKIHDIFCDMPGEQKLNFAVQCAIQGIKPCDLESAVFKVMQNMESNSDVVLSNLSYWTKEE